MANIREGRPEKSALSRRCGAGAAARRVAGRGRGAGGCGVSAFKKARRKAAQRACTAARRRERRGSSRGAVAAARRSARAAALLQHLPHSVPKALATPLRGDMNSDGSRRKAAPLTSFDPTLGLEDARQARARPAGGAAAQRTARPLAV
jgi:hypothetical protein